MPRFRLRTLMISVAIMALLIFAGREYSDAERRSLDYALHACDHELGMAFHSQGRTSPFGTTPDPKKVAYHRAMAAKWRWAARHPWLPVAPDPPEPE